MKLVFMSHRYFNLMFRKGIRGIGLIERQTVTDVAVRANVKIASINPDCVLMYGGKRDQALVNDCLQFWDHKVKLVPWWKMLSRPKIDLRLDDRVIVIKFNKTTGCYEYILFYRKLPTLRGYTRSSPEGSSLYNYVSESRGAAKWLHHKDWLGQDVVPLTSEEYFARRLQLSGLE